MKDQDGHWVCFSASCRPVGIVAECEEYRHTSNLHDENQGFFTGGFSYGAARCKNRTAPYDFASKQNAPHCTVDSRIKKSAPHRTALRKTKKHTAPHRKIWWQSVEQAFPTVRVELIRRTNPPRTVSSNYVNRVKCNDLCDESY